MLRDDQGRLLCCVCGTPVERHICAQDWKPIVDRAIDDHEQRLRDHERRLTALESERAVGDAEHVLGCKQPWKPYPACRCVEILTHERDEAYRNNAVLSEQRDEAGRLLDGEQRNHDVTIRRVRDVTAERDRYRVALRTILAVTNMGARLPHGDAYNAAAAALASATPAEGGEG